MKLQLQISTHDRMLGFHIMGTDSLSTGANVSAPGGATVEYQGALAYKALGIPETLQFIVDLSIAVDSGLLAAWLYDKVKDSNVERIVIRRRIITNITQSEIRQVIEEEIEEHR